MHLLIGQSIQLHLLVKWKDWKTNFPLHILCNSVCRNYILMPKHNTTVWVLHTRMRSQELKVLSCLSEASPRTMLFQNHIQVIRLESYSKPRVIPLRFLNKHKVSLAPMFTLYTSIKPKYAVQHSLLLCKISFLSRLSEKT